MLEGPLHIQDKEVNKVSSKLAGARTLLLPDIPILMSQAHKANAKIVDLIWCVIANRYIGAMLKIHQFSG
jgi:hypothetical protein